MDITDMYMMKALAFGRLLAGQCMSAGCGGQIVEVEAGIKGEKTVRNFGI